MAAISAVFGIHGSDYIWSCQMPTDRMEAFQAGGLKLSRSTAMRPYPNPAFGAGRMGSA